MKKEIPDYQKDIDAAVERLQEYSEYEGSETGEVWYELARFWESYRDYVSEEFKEALKKEIIIQACDTHIYYKLVEKEYTEKIKTKYLEYLLG